MPSEDEEDTSSSATKAKALAVAEKYAAIALDSLCFQQKLAKSSEKAVEIPRLPSSTSTATMATTATQQLRKSPATTEPFVVRVERCAEVMLALEVRTRSHKRKMFSFEKALK